MARVLVVSLDLGTSNTSISPLCDESRGKQVAVEAQVELELLALMVQLVERKRAVLGGSGPFGEQSVGQVVGDEEALLIDLDGVNYVVTQLLCISQSHTCNRSNGTGNKEERALITTTPSEL